MDRIAVLTGTLMGGYADDLFNVLYRSGTTQDGDRRLRVGRIGSPQLRGELRCPRASDDHYARRECLLESEEDQAGQTQTGRIATAVRQVSSWNSARSSRWKTSPVQLSAYREEVIGVDMDEPLAKAYADLEKQIKEALEEHRGNHSVISTALNALLAYPDRPCTALR